MLSSSLGLWALGPVQIRQQAVSWQNDEGQRLQGTLWLPAEAGPWPAIIAVHGVMSDRGHFRLAGQAWAQAGFAVLTFDLRGYGVSAPAPDTPEAHQADVLTAIRFLRQQPLIDSQKLALIGHSMGATAVEWAAPQAGQIEQAFALGMRPSLQVSAQAGEHQRGGHESGAIQWLTGRFDHLHPPAEFPPLQPPLWVSPSANHQSESQDLRVISYVQQRLQAAWQLPPRPLAWQLFLRHWLILLLCLATLGLLVSLPAFQPGGYPAVFGLSGLLAALAGCAYLGWLPAGSVKGASLVLLLAYFLAGWPARLHRLWPLLLGLWLCRETVTLVRTAPQWAWPVPELGNLVLYLWQSLCSFSLAAERLNQLLYTLQGERWVPHWPLLAVLMLEWLYPGWWRRLLQRSWKPSLPQNQRGLWLALAAGLLALSVLLGLRFQQGYLNSAGLAQVLRVSLRDFLPTGLLFGALLWGLRWRTLHSKSGQETQNSP